MACCRWHRALPPTWTRAGNPQQGGDGGGGTYSSINSEAYAALFAFLANVDADATRRAQWAGRGRSLLLYILNQVDVCMRAQPPRASGPFCNYGHATSDRMRWQGAGYPLAVDWLQNATLANGQPALTAADIAMARRVFLWWSLINQEGYGNPYNNPSEYSLPVGTVGEPLLRQPQDVRRFRLRHGGNNYFAGRMRHLGLMALAIDADDDVLDPLSPATFLKITNAGTLAEFPLNDANGRLRGFLPHVFDAWLFMQDYVLRNDGRGGMPPEGMEYAPTSIGIPAQFLYALETAGLHDLANQSLHGERSAALDTNLFYRDVVPTFIHSLSPRTVANPNRGTVFQPAWYGDGEHYYQGDPISIFGPLALHAMRIGDQTALATLRWLQRHVPPGGSAELSDRTRSREDVLEGVLYFLMFDPLAPSSAANAPDPRPLMPQSVWGEGMGRLLSRTDWGSDARWFNAKFGWDTIDHQHGDAGMLEFYRRGEWLTMGILGYGLEGGSTDYKNAPAIFNTQWPGTSNDNFVGRRLLRGSQMPQQRSIADPSVQSRSEAADYSWLSGTTTGAYNAWYLDFDPTPPAQRADDVTHASRSLLWLKPDVIVIYDRATTQAAGLAKQFWLNLPDRLPSFPTISNNLVTAHTPGGQRLYVTSLLPAQRGLTVIDSDPEINAVRQNFWSLGDEHPFIQVRPYLDPISGQPTGDDEPFATRLRIAATGNPNDVRFLTVLQGADAATVATAASSVASIAAANCSAAGDAFQGAAIGAQLVMFRRDLANAADCLSYDAPAAATTHTITALQPWGAYTVTREIVAGTPRVHVRPGGSLRADAGGVLRFNPLALPAPLPWLQADVERLHYAVVAIGAQRALGFSLHNRGASDLHLSAINVEGVAAGDYTLGGDCLGALTLAPAATCQLNVTFHPSLAGFRDARVAINADGVVSSLRLALLGVGELSSLPLDLLFRSDFE